MGRRLFLASGLSLRHTPVCRRRSTRGAGDAWRMVLAGYLPEYRACPADDTCRLLTVVSEISFVYCLLSFCHYALNLLRVAPAGYLPLCCELLPYSICRTPTGMPRPPFVGYPPYTCRSLRTSLQMTSAAYPPLPRLPAPRYTGRLFAGAKAMCYGLRGFLISPGITIYPARDSKLSRSG